MYVKMGTEWSAVTCGGGGDHAIKLTLHTKH
jgi:hypothetical protein